MGEVTTIGLDLAKHVFQVHGVDAAGECVLRKQLRRGTRLQPNQAARQCGKERYHLAAPKLLAQNHRTARVDPVHLENMLRQIQPDRRNLVHGWLLRWCVFTNHHSGT